jgi:hypothetical protein
MSEIDDKYNQLGRESSFLGHPQQDERCCPDGVGHYRTFQHGSIHSHPSTGAHETHGAIGNKWAALKWETGPLGYPTSDERTLSESEIKELVRGDDISVVSQSYNRCSEFQGGKVYFWSPDNHRNFTTVILTDGTRTDDEHHDHHQHHHRNHAIKCRKCGHSEETTVELIVKVIGGAMPVGGFWAWVAYLFAGTGLALPIVIALITGGVGILVFKDEIVQWIVNRGYKCPRCGAVDWEA